VRVGVEGGCGSSEAARAAESEEQHNGQQKGYFKFKKNNFFKILNQIKGNSIDDFEYFEVNDFS
jgi:hypothetical protein